MTGTGVDGASANVPTISVRIGDAVRCGWAVTVAADVEPVTLVEAVRSPDAAADGRVAVDAPAPGPVHEHVGHVRPGMGLRTRTALARAARSRGLETPHDDALASVRDRLAATSVEEGDITSRRRAVAEAATETERLRERVATVRGKLQAAREHGGDAGAVSEELASAVRQLSETETDSLAARQRFERVREHARERRDRRERVRKLEDKLANLERDARAHLVEQLADRYADAVADAPGAERVADPLDADPVTAALAVGRLASLSAPVVLACDRFASAAAASRWLGAPVVRV